MAVLATAAVSLSLTLEAATSFHLCFYVDGGIRENAVEPPSATRWLIRHAVLGGYVTWWLLGWRGKNQLLTSYTHYAYANTFSYTREHWHCRKLLRALLQTPGATMIQTEKEARTIAQVEGAPRQAPEPLPDHIATQYRMPDEPPGGAGWLHRILSIVSTSGMITRHTKAAVYPQGTRIRLRSTGDKILCGKVDATREPGKNWTKENPMWLHIWTEFPSKKVSMETVEAASEKRDNSITVFVPKL
ncbi:hypothetical protein B0H19DRAFT_1243162 [Mycena capillaripes]|nr:hypothetical protein B0H19DRAFT_1243162 [Mycena capillaripes]